MLVFFLVYKCTCFVLFVYKAVNKLQIAFVIDILKLKASF